MVCVYDQSPPLHLVLELPDCREDSEELAVDGAVPRLRVLEPPAEEGEWLEVASDVLVHAVSEALVVKERVACRTGCMRREAEARACLNSWTACSISAVTLNLLLEQDRESVKGRMI